MTSGQQILQFLATGITNGSIYALIALGFVVIHSVTSVINFAQGEFAMLGALLTISLVAAGLPQGLAVAVAVAGVGVFSAILYRAALRPARDASPLTMIIITIGAALSIRGVALAIWGTEPYAMQPFTSGSPLQLGGAVVRLQSVWVLGVTLLRQPLLHLFFTRTILGRSLRACAVNRLAARLMGIRTDRMALLAFGLSGAVGALGAGLVSSGYKDAIAFVALFVILLSKPRWIVRSEEGTEEGS